MSNRINKSATFTIRPFEKLGKKLEGKKVAVTPKPILHTNKKTISEEELFSEAMNDVHEIESFREMSCARPVRKGFIAPNRRDPDDEALLILYEIANGQRPIELADTQEYVEWINPDYKGDIIQRLHTGQFSVQAFLDLHGCTSSEAETEIEAFLKDSFQKGLRCVKIIHGRGLRSARGPILKNFVVRLLSGHYRKNIIAFVTARQCDGGLGALYVLLRKK